MNALRPLSSVHILLDLHLPRVDGFEILRRLAASSELLRGQAR